MNELVYEYGAEHSGTIMLLHGGGLSWWNYREAAELLQQRYHLLLPVLHGHAQSPRAFTSIEDNAAALLDYIEERCGGSLLLLGGLSLGGQIAAEMLARKPGLCRYALLESVAVLPAPLLSALLPPTLALSYGLTRKRWFARLQFRQLGLPPLLFDDYYRDTQLISAAGMLAFMQASSAYGLKPGLANSTARTVIVAGGREGRRIKRSAALLQQNIPLSRLQIIDGNIHGQLSLEQAPRFAAIIDELTGR